MDKSTFLYWAAEYVNNRPTGRYCPLEFTRNDKGTYDTYVIISNVAKQVKIGMNVVGYFWIESDGKAVIEYFGS